MKEKILIENIDLEFARKITIKQAMKYQILPLFCKDNIVYVARSMENREGEEFLDFILKMKICYIHVKEEELNYLIHGVLDYEHENLEEVIFKEAIKSNASDIHFEPLKEALNVRFRIHGSLIVVRKLRLKEYGKILLRLKVNSNMDIAEKRKPQDGKLIIKCEGKSYNCRLSTMPVVYGEKVVLRILYDEIIIKDIKNMNFTKIQLEDLNKIIKSENGLVLICGPTGSGKSTTLYSILNKIKDNNINISTLEDPIEVIMEGINQTNLNVKKGITFSSGLRALLRQDPDCIMIGEIRDEDTAKMAVRAAITGHKVYSTIHTKSPKEALLRLEEMGVSDYLVNSSIKGIVCQRLVKVLCDNCKVCSGKVNFKGKNIKVFNRGSCRKCNGVGYIGRILVSSVVYISKNIRENMEKYINDEKKLTNIQMKAIIDNLLLEGKIAYSDYSNFILGEELDG